MHLKGQMRYTVKGLLYAKGGILISNRNLLLKRLGITAGVLVLAIVFGLMIWGAALRGGDTVFPNVCVAGVNLGGMNREEAVKALESGLAATRSERALTVQLPDRKLIFESEKTNSPLDLEALAEEAMAYGRSESLLKIPGIYRSCKRSGHILDGADALNVNQEYIRQVIEETARDVAQEMEESQISVSEDETKIFIQIGRPGRRLDTEKLFEKIMEAYASEDLSDIEFSYDLVPYSLVDLQPYYTKYCIPAKDAYYDTQEDTLVPEVIGYGFDLMAVNQQIALAEEGSLLEITLQEVKPAVTRENWKETNFPDTLATYASPYTSNADRTTNLRLACEAIDGTVLEPGEVFSFNQAVGERTAEKGYRKGIIYADGGASEAELGGGVCQVASTMYMCVLLADFEATEREPHMYTVSYVPMGMDATIYWGSFDFKFRNTNSTSILINATCKNGYVTITYSGIMEHDYTVKMSYELLSTIEWEEKEEVDDTIPVGTRKEKWSPITGYTCWSYKSYYDLNGKFLRKEKCAFSEYKKRDHVFLVNSKTQEAEQEQEQELPQQPVQPITPPETAKPTTPPTPQPSVPPYGGRDEEVSNSQAPPKDDFFLKPNR